MTDSKAGSCDSRGNNSGNVEQGLIAALGKEGDKHWPKINNAATSDTALYTRNGEPYKKDASSTVAKDLTKLTPEEKTIVAGLLAKTIEGGEVVEICVSP
ncbi:hypothetical protein ANAPC5_00101 [Anaplasma phagocytophilum]|nr:hypothetical protein [Anaplasma phagocytophilum]SBO30261.1 hypothetical protein ANAPC4_00143 [Anaplasma phagocytophilum]SBO30345.1 hypothetical protein ANAPC3_00175 [Anaplasma phagocytophilum]SBO30704.1 hypothetical protein ANAPC2_00361 [Anaplasma phagocytophilum]SCV61882.1 hypothetical protein ANAPC5_00101 [Anaplasma phagocytophilum]